RTDFAARVAVLVRRERRDREGRAALPDAPDERAARLLPGGVAAVGGRENRAGEVIPGNGVDEQDHGADRGAVEIGADRAADPLPCRQVRISLSRLAEHLSI